MIGMTRPHEARQSDWGRLAHEPWQALVVGGGIVGACIARDAAQRGLRVALVDQQDFAAGTSSRSSRLLHGGLRYLAQGRVGLVREASHEKRTLARIAPHLVQPLEFAFPAYAGSGWPHWQLRAGVKLYDWLCGDGNFRPSRSLSSGELAGIAPGLRQEGLSGGVAYFDALTNDARLVLDTLRSARDEGALALNYVRLLEASPADRGHWRCLVEDLTSGRAAAVETACVVNAAGPWADQFRQAGVQLRHTKGVHLVFDHERLPVSTALVMPHGERIVFAIPWGCRTYVGTTDTDYSGDLADPEVSPDDIDELLGVLGHFFPAACLSPADIKSSWAGIRPLLQSRGRPSEVSRSHRIAWARAGWLDVAGGKLTTSRLMGEQAVDALVTWLGLPKIACRTAELPLVPDHRAAPGDEVLPPVVSRNHVERACREEWARTLTDLMIHRTSWHYYLGSRQEIATQAARWMANVCGWSDEHRAAELACYESLLPATDRATVSPP
jgi:glycerol-3-phosphate dehydrogenase